MKELALLHKGLLALLILTALLAGCAGPKTPGPGAFQTIRAEEAKALMEDGDEYILVDVRTQSEFDEGHIKGALLLPDFEIEEKAEALLPDKNARILLYCRSGRRSAQAAHKLAELGYTNVLDFGGIIDWPYETEAKS